VNSSSSCVAPQRTLRDEIMRKLQNGREGFTFGTAVGGEAATVAAGSQGGSGILEGKSGTGGPLPVVPRWRSLADGIVSQYLEQAGYRRTSMTFSAEVQVGFTLRCFFFSRTECVMADLQGIGQTLAPIRFEDLTPEDVRQLEMEAERQDLSSFLFFFVGWLCKLIRLPLCARDPACEGVAEKPIA